MAFPMCRVECHGPCEDPSVIAQSRGLCGSAKDNGRLTHIIRILISVKYTYICVVEAGFVREAMLCIMH